MAIEELQNGRYKCLRRLGSGGMGEVYLMQDRRVNRRVAIKVLRAEGAFSPDDATSTTSARLFEREARAIATLDHPNILPLYDFGEEKLDDGSITYMVMPYCAEGSLETWLRQRGHNLLPAPQVAALIEQAAEGLFYAHEHKVIHLDVKPPNFLIRTNRKEPLLPTLLLADFGISRNFSTVSSSSHTIRGTPAAMAPEQWSGTPVFASDQYALAVMTYEMLVGRPPFTGSMEQLMYRHFSMQPQPPGTLNPRLPQAIDAVLLRSLSKKPEERYPTIADFASALVEATNQPSAYSEAELAEYRTLNVSPSESEMPRVSAQVSEAPAVQEQARQTPETLLPFGQTPTQPFLSQAPAAPILRPGVSLSGQVPEQSSLLLPSSAPVSSSDHYLPTVASLGSAGRSTTAPTPMAKPRRSFGVFVLVSVLVVLLVLASSIFYFASHQGSARVQTTPTHAVPTATPSPTPVPPGEYIAGTYNGSMANNDGSQLTQISVHIVQTNGSGALSGTVTFNSATSYPLHGIVDMQGNFSFSVDQPAGQIPLVLHGSFQNGDFLHGYYCSSNTGTCPSNTGYFTVGPRF